MRNKFGFLILILFGLLISCSHRQQSATLKFSGTLELTEYSLGSKIPGAIASLGVNEGDQVKAGQVIATLDRYEQAKKDYERTAMLFKQGGTTAQALEYAALARDDQAIISPVDGIVLVKVHEVGETVAAGGVIVVIGDTNNFWIKIYVPEGVINKIQLQQPATLHFDGIKESSPGHISYISPKAEFTPRNVQTHEERITQTFAVKVALDNPSASLHPGVAADVTIKTDK